MGADKLLVATVRARGATRLECYRGLIAAAGDFKGALHAERHTGSTYVENGADYEWTLTEGEPEPAAEPIGLDAAMHLECSERVPFCQASWAAAVIEPESPYPPVTCWRCWEKLASQCAAVLQQRAPIAPDAAAPDRLALFHEWERAAEEAEEYGTRYNDALEARERTRTALLAALEGR